MLKNDYTSQDYSQVSTPITKSGSSTADVRAIGFRDSLRDRNIYINRRKPPSELVKRAKGIITHERSSPELDDATAQKLEDTARSLEAGSEQEILYRLGLELIPAKEKISSPVTTKSLKSSSNES